VELPAKRDLADKDRLEGMEDVHTPVISCIDGRLACYPTGSASAAHPLPHMPLTAHVYYRDISSNLAIDGTRAMPILRSEDEKERGCPCIYERILHVSNKYLLAGSLTGDLATYSSTGSPQLGP